MGGDLPVETLLPSLLSIAKGVLGVQLLLALLSSIPALGPMDRVCAPLTPANCTSISRMVSSSYWESKAEDPLFTPRILTVVGLTFVALVAQGLVAKAKALHARVQEATAANAKVIIQMCASMQQAATERVELVKEVFKDVEVSQERRREVVVELCTLLQSEVGRRDDVEAILRMCGVESQSQSQSQSSDDGTGVVGGGRGLYGAIPRTSYSGFGQEEQEDELVGPKEVRPWLSDDDMIWNRVLDGKRASADLPGAFLVPMCDLFPYFATGQPCCKCFSQPRTGTPLSRALVAAVLLVLPITGLVVTAMWASHLTGDVKALDRSVTVDSCTYVCSPQRPVWQFVWMIGAGVLSFFLVLAIDEFRMAIGQTISSGGLISDWKYVLQSGSADTQSLVVEAAQQAAKVARHKYLDSTKKMIDFMDEQQSNDPDQKSEKDKVLTDFLLRRRPSYPDSTEYGPYSSSYE